MSFINDTLPLGIGVGVRVEEEIVEDGVVRHEWSTTYAGMLELLCSGRTVILRTSRVGGDFPFNGPVPRHTSGLLFQNVDGFPINLDHIVMEDGTEFFEPRGTDEMMTWIIETDNGRLIVHDTDEARSVFIIERVEVFEDAVEEQQDNDQDNNLLNQPPGDEQFLIARIGVEYDPMDTPSWWNPRAEDEEPGFRDRLTEDDVGTIVAFTIGDNGTRMYPVFIWNDNDEFHEWIPLYMSDQVLRPDGDRWYMYHGWEFDGRVTLSTENLPNNLAPVPVPFTQ